MGRTAGRLVAGIWLLLVTGACGGLGEDDPAPFSLTVTPTEIMDTAPGQHVLLLVTVEDGGEGEGEGEPVTITASAEGSEVTIEPDESIAPGEVGEITVILGAGSAENAATPAAGPVLVAFQPEPSEIVTVSIQAEREGLTQNAEVPLGIVPNGDFPLEMAEQVRDIFVPWLAENHPELGISQETGWTATTTKPHILVVSYYLFISERWEMGVRWHIMIPPDNWAEIYLRERFVEVQPTLGFKVDSWSEPAEPYPVEVVEPVWR